MKILVALSCFLVGGFVSALLVFMLMTDEVGRHKQYIYTLDRVLEESDVKLTKSDVLDTVKDMYPIKEIIVENDAIYVHRLEFHFDSGIYEAGSIGNYRK